MKNIRDFGSSSAKCDFFISISSPEVSWQLWVKHEIIVDHYPLVTLVVNIWAIIIIRKKEKTGIHNLIICDCIANVLSMTYGTFK